ncbi:MAG: AAA family ATPase [Deltaproteobacteria bacterium]
MSLINSLKEILGVTPVNIGDLNRQAARQPRRSGHPEGLLNSLDGIEVTEEYRRIYALLDKGSPMVFVSGKAGTGKTTLVHHLREKLDKNIVVVAPTGVAALNVKGVTIHSFFRFPPRMIADEDIKEVRNRRVYEKIDVLIIDEISMVRADLMDAMDLFLRLNGPVSDKPFGGIQVLFVGDLFQLPPVVNKKEDAILEARQYETPFFFSAKVLQGCQFAPVELSKIYRQTDTQFTNMLNRVRVAEELESVVPYLNQNCCGPSKDHPSLITLTCTNAAADQINKSKLDELSGEMKTFSGEVSGKFAVQEEKFPSPLRLQLKPGA